MGGITSLLLLLWAGVTVSTVVNLQKRIYNGKPCGPKERLYHVKITNEDDKFYCGGSLISNQWILTAAHCWEWGMKVVLSVHPDPSKGIPVTIEAPPVMFGYETNRIHDIMLLKLPKPITDYQPDKTKIQTINIPDCGEKLKTVQVAGHAATDKKSCDQGVGETLFLQCAEMDIDKCPPCYDSKAFPHILCGNTALVDICNGDSGGGVVYNGKIYGVISHRGKKVCMINAAFTEVCKYKKWIEKAIKDDFFKNFKEIENI